MSAPVASGAAGPRSELGRTGLLVGGTGLASGIGLLYIALASRALGPARAADFYAGLFLVFVALTLASPLTNALTQLAALATGRGERERIAGLRRSALRALALAGALAALPLGLAWHALLELGRFEAPAALGVACAAAWLTALLGVDRAILRGQQRFGAFCAHLLFEVLSRLAIGLLLLTLVADAPAALAPIALSALATAILGHVLVRESVLPPGAASAAELAEFRGLALSMLVLAFADAGYQNFDVFVVKATSDSAASAAYGAAAALARGFGVLMTPFVTFALPALAAEQVRGRATRELMGRTLGYALALAAPPLALIALYPDAIARAALGREFAAAAPLLLPLSLSTLIGFLSILLLQEFVVLRRFGIGALYVGGFGVEAGALAGWHASPIQVARIALATKALAFAVLLLAWAGRRRGWA